MADGTTVLPTIQAAPARALVARPRNRFWRGHLQGSEYAWALAFLVPYATIFLLFVLYPICFGFWMGSQPSLYSDLFSDPIYQSTVVNTLLYLLIDVNLEVG